MRCARSGESGGVRRAAGASLSLNANGPTSQAAVHEEGVDDEGQQEVEEEAHGGDIRAVAKAARDHPPANPRLECAKGEHEGEEALQGGV